MIRIHEVTLHQTDLRTRMPFRYGIASMTEAPHLFVRVEAEVGGRRAVGVSADVLPPKWFTKNPTTPFEEDLAEMLAVIRAAAGHAVEAGERGSVFDLWSAMYQQQARWAAGHGYPPLLWHFGVTLLERAAIDATCRATQTSFSDLLRHDRLGVQLEHIHPQLAGLTPRRLLPPEPRHSLIARHTVGLSDPLVDREIAEADRLDDGLPQSLEACIGAYGLTHFKIKLSGDASRDRDRLLDIAALLDRCVGEGYRHTLDGNENFREPEAFRDLWEALAAEERLRRFMGALLFVEQPLHRDVALSDEVGRAFGEWSDRPPMIIDESDASTDSLPRALELGYAGTSHKNCKGVCKGIANACLLAERRLSRPGEAVCFSGEDLTNLGPVALLQDLAVAAHLGIEHLERNGHHYFRGLTPFPDAVQEATLAAHGDLYRRHENGYPTLDIRGGKLQLNSILDAPFGYAMDFDPAGVDEFSEVPID